MADSFLCLVRLPVGRSEVAVGRAFSARIGGVDIPT